MKSFSLYDDLVAKQLFFIVLDLTTQGLNLSIMKHETIDSTTSHNVVFAHSERNDSSCPRSLLCSSLSLLSHSEQSDAGHKLMTLLTMMPHPQMPSAKYESLYSYYQSYQSGGSLIHSI